MNGTEWNGMEWMNRPRTKMRRGYTRFPLFFAAIPIQRLKMSITDKKQMKLRIQVTRQTMMEKRNSRMSVLLVCEASDVLGSCRYGV